ncbi:MAG TPA: addiction module protein [Pirellulaceae bacterium]|jgi:putative addiction module component (TIGR02574 family)
MSADMLIAEALKLSPQDRLRIVEALWDSTPDEGVDFSLSEDQLRELERRLADYEANPNEGSDWQEVLARIEKQL